MNIQSYGIGCTSNEPTTIIVNKPQRMSEDEIAFRDAKDESDRLWEWQIKMVDAGDPQDAIDEFTDRCIAAEHKAHMLYNCWQWNHPNRVEVGSIHMTYEGLSDDTREVCVDCGKSVFGHTHIVANIEAKS